MTNNKKKRTKKLERNPNKPIIIVDPLLKERIEKVNEFWNRLESTSHPDDFLWPEQIIVGAKLQLKEAYSFNIGLCIGELILKAGSYVTFKKYIDKEKKTILQVAYPIDQNLDILFEISKDKLILPYGVIDYHDDEDQHPTNRI